MRGFVGFGGALISILVVSLLIGPRAAVAIAAISGIPAMFQLLPAAIKHSERNFVLPFAIATLAAAPLGTLVLVSLDQALMKMAIAAFVLLMVAMLWRGWSLSAGGTTGTVAAGAISGFIQGSAGIGGPPAVTVALSRPGTAQQQRANTIGAVSGLNLCAMGPLWYFGLFTPAGCPVRLRDDAGLFSRHRTGTTLFCQRRAALLQRGGADPVSGYWRHHFDHRRTGLPDHRLAARQNSQRLS